jgi:hypothetical protein
VSQAVVQSTVEFTSDLCSDIVSSIKESTSRTLLAHNVPVEEIRQLEAKFDELSNPFRGLETEGKRRRKIAKSICYVAPESKSLGPSTRSVTVASGSSQTKFVEDTFQFVPLRKQMKVLLENTCLMAKILECKESENRLLRSVLDGTYIKNLPPSDVPVVWILLFYDDLETANALGPHAVIHKLACFYFSIVNVSPKYSSALRNVFLAAVAKTVDVKHYGIDRVTETLLDQFKDLENNLLEVTTDNYTGPVRIRLCQVTGDNLGLHSLFGFVECFVANFPCRRCCLSLDEVRHAVVVRPDKGRTVEGHTRDVIMTY